MDQQGLKEQEQTWGRTWLSYLVATGWSLNFLESAFSHLSMGIKKHTPPLTPRVTVKSKYYDAYEASGLVPDTWHILSMSFLPFPFR